MKKREDNKPNETNDEMQSLRLELVREKVRKMNISADAEEAKLKLWQQQNSNKFMETAVVLGAVETFAQHIGRLQDDAFECEHGALARAESVAQRVFGGSTEQLAVFQLQLRPELKSLNSGMKNDNAEHWKDLWQQLVKDRKVSIAKTMKE
jgi:hypothetical protein